MCLYLADLYTNTSLLTSLLD